MSTLSAQAPRAGASGSENEVIGRIGEASLARWSRLTAGLGGATRLVIVPDLEPFGL